MAVTISAPVGYKSANRPDDVRKVHDLLKRVSPGQGGPPASFNPATPYSPAVTDQHIYNFQVKQFGKGPNADAVVDPSRETLKRLNALAGGGGGVGINPPAGPPAGSLPPTTPPGGGGGGSPKPDPGGSPVPAGYSRVGAILGPAIVSHAYVAGYQGKPVSMKLGRFKVPTYNLRLGLVEAKGDTFDLRYATDWEVIRFGVRYFDERRNANLPEDQWWIVQGTCEGDFTLERADYLGGAWRIKGAYYIHVGPGSPRWQGNDAGDLTGALGCVEIINGNWQRFQQAVRMCAIGEDYLLGRVDDAEADRLITEHKLFRLRVDRAPTPPLVKIGW